jgi:membrane protein required for colicin V production
MEMPMIWADWILLAALLVSIVIGIIRGFTREFFGLVSWIVAIAAALLLAPAAHGWLEPHIATPSLRIAASYAVVFFAFLVIGAIVTAVISSLVRKNASLSAVDRSVGGGFGLIRGVLVGVVLVWLVGLTPARQDPWWGRSMLIPGYEWLANGFRGLLPEAWQRYATPAGDAAEQAADAAKKGL